MGQEGKTEKKLNVQAKSLFLELGNVGTGSAMTSLSNMLGTELIYTPPKLLEVWYEDLSRWFVESEENVAGVLVPFEGEISGFLIQIYRLSTAKKILGILLGPEHEEERALDREGLDLLHEISNIMASSCLLALSSYTASRIRVLESAVSVDMAGSILTELFGTASGIYGAGLGLGACFCFSGEDSDNRILLILGSDSMSRFLEELEVGA